MFNPYRFLAQSDHPLAKGVRDLRRKIYTASLPVPGAAVKPALWAYLLGRELSEELRRMLIAEPLFKASCREYGEGLHTGCDVHYIIGKGDIVVGDHVKFDGKVTIIFASRFSERPTLKVGDKSWIGDGCLFTIGKQITIGNHCRIPGGVWMFDSSGHPADPAARKADQPPKPEDVKPITVCDNVWIGGKSIVFPGVTIGENSVVSAGSVVMSDVAPNSIVAGNPARKIASLQPTAATAAPAAKPEQVRGAS